MQLFIKRVSNMIFIDNIDPSNTIEELKERLCKKNGIPVHQQIFIVDGKILESHKTLYDYAIIDGKIITLVVHIN